MDYQRLAATSTRLIRAMGRQATLSRVVIGEYSPSKASAPESPAQTYVCEVVTLDYSNREIDGTDILTGDVRGIVSSPQIEPQVGDTIAIDGVTYRVVTPRPIRPGGITLAYELQLRRP